jgi:Tol biopolymer transport system component
MRSGHPVRRLVTALFATVLVGGVLGACGNGSETPPGHGILFAADQEPRLSGEIYAVTLQGKQVDLSRSFYEDTDSIISPDGKRVAFVSGRAGYPAVYVVGIDGYGLKQLSPKPAPGERVDWYSASWSPDGKKLVVDTEAGSPGKGGDTTLLYVLEPGHSGRVIARLPGSYGPLTGKWSPDGRLIEFGFADRVRVLTPSGSPVFAVSGLPEPFSSAWSPDGRLVVVGGKKIRLYDQRGQLLTALAGQAFAFSPDGERLATILGRRLEVRDDGGLGRLILSKVVVSKSKLKSLGGDYQPQLYWLGANRVLVSPAGLVERINYGYYPALGVDLPAGNVGPVSYRVWLSSVPCLSMGSSCGSPDHSLVTLTTKVDKSFALRVMKVNGSGARTLALVPACLWKGELEDSITDLQFSPDGRTLVYRSVCAEPYTNLYSIAPNGRSLRRLTKINREQDSPAWSPDGRRIAFVQARWAGSSCYWCPATIWVMDANGKNPRQLTFQPDSNWDAFPSWSPDGHEILYGHADNKSEPFALRVVPASGGDARNLDIKGGAPAWGPNRIAYLDVHSRVWTALPDGTDKRRITGSGENGPWASSLTWSKDGRLAWLSESENDKTLAEKVTLEILTANGKRRSFPLGEFEQAMDLAWSPDGLRFALAAAPPEGPFDVYTISDTGSDLKRITHGLRATSVSWR